MRKLIAITRLPLDGVMQAPGGPDEDRQSGCSHGGWAMLTGGLVVATYRPDGPLQAG
jgi:hypothetical protein